MPHIFGQQFSPAELRAHTATIDQLAGVRLVEYSEGKARGMRAAEVWTGSGFRFTVWIDRGMDIGPAEYKGASLAWLPTSRSATSKPSWRGCSRETSRVFRKTTVPT